MDYGLTDLVYVGLAVFLLGMNKGGMPLAGVAMPVLILLWPDPARSARDAVAFVLPLLCVMDVFAIVFYRRYILWKTLLPLMPGVLFGVALATLLFVPESGALIEVSDRALKAAIGVMGLVFVAFRAARSWIARKLSVSPPPHPAQASLYGFTAGITSTLAHAAGPVMQMYLLPRKLDRMNFAATNAGFFFALNLIKVAPFAVLGRFSAPNLQLALVMLPVIPAGVAAGFLLVRAMKTAHYTALIYAVLAVTSVLLIVKAIG